MMVVQAGVQGVLHAVGRRGVVGAGEHRAVLAGGVFGLQAGHALGADEASAVAAQALDDDGFKPHVGSLDSGGRARAARADDADVGLDGFSQLAELRDLRAPSISKFRHHWALSVSSAITSRKRFANAAPRCSSPSSKCPTTTTRASSGRVAITADCSSPPRAGARVLPALHERPGCFLPPRQHPPYRAGGLPLGLRRCSRQGTGGIEAIFEQCVADCAQRLTM